MNTHLLARLARKSFLLTSILVLPVCLNCIRARAELGSLAQGCGSTFAVTWQGQSDTNIVLTFSQNGNAFEGPLTQPGKVNRVLKGNMTDSNNLQGTWYEEQIDVGGQSGTFVATLTPSEERMNLTLYVNRQQFEVYVFRCGSSIGSGSSGATGGTTTPTPPPLPTPTPIRDDQDQDNFQTFDSLTQEQQITVLTRRGPRLRVEYDAYDFAARIIVRRGSPILIDYSLDSDLEADVTIELPDSGTSKFSLRPARRTSATLPIYRLRSQYAVAKLSIRAFTSTGAPANFELYGLAVGERGMQALRRSQGEEVLVAMNKIGLNSENEPLSLFNSLPQSGLALQIKVDLPATLRAKQKPENKIVFSCSSDADFSDGRWEWSLVSGLHWKKVWQHGTGSLSRNQVKSEDWNGIITSRKLVSVGAHALQLIAWQKSGDDRDSVIARAPARLAVVQ